MKVHHFTNGDFGYYADWWDADDFKWDGQGDTEPTEDDIKEAREYWHRDGYNEAMQDAADDEADRHSKEG